MDTSGRYGSAMHGSSDPLSLFNSYERQCVCEESFMAELKKSTKFNKSFILDAHPWILSASGPTCATLVADQVSQYLEFRPIQKNGVITSKGERLFVPSSKEDIFLDTNLSLIEKRQLSRMLTLKVEDETKPFKEVIAGFTEKLQETILHGMLMSNSNITCKEAFERLTAYKDGLGRYGPGTAPFLLPLYGTSEISQAYCRQAAVNGATFIMGQSFDVDGQVITGQYEAKKWTAEFTEEIQNSHEIENVNRMTLVLDGPFAGEWGTNIWTIVNADGTATRLLCTSADSGCAPKHFYIAHAWSESDTLREPLKEHLSFPGQSNEGPNVLFCYSHNGPRPVLGSHTEPSHLNSQNKSDP